jgi:ferric-dicitrate binding protein FerR (iron transport regulator)
VGELPVAQRALEAGALLGGQLGFPLGQVAEGTERLVAGVAEEPFAEPGARAQRHDEAHTCLVDLTHRLWLTHRGVTHDQQARPGDRQEPFQRRADQRQLGGVAGVGAAVEHGSVSG